MNIGNVKNKELFEKAWSVASTRGADSTMPKEHALVLCGLLDGIDRGGFGVEIGTRFGRFISAASVYRADMRFCTVDIEDNYPSSKNSVLGKNVLRIIQSSVSASKTMRLSSADFVFVDGDHTYQGVCDDINSWMPVLKPGGIMVFHDFRNSRYINSDGDIVDVFVEKAFYDTMKNYDHEVIVAKDPFAVVVKK